MAVLEWKKDGTVAVVSMINGENRVNPVLINEMLTVMDEIERDESICAVVITSSDPKNWSQGIDLDWMGGRFAAKDLQSVRNFFYGLGDVVKRFLLYPMPVIAAINGHVVAAGGILACACDFRFMRADRGFFFLPEIDVDVAFQPGFTALVRKAIPEPKLTEMLYTAKRYSASELDAHSILKACENETKLMEECMAFARSFNKRRINFREMKRNLNEWVLKIMEKDDPAFIEGLRQFPPF